MDNRNSIERLKSIQLSLSELSNSEQRRINYIKNRLPWYVTIFRTIPSYEISLRETSIFIGVSFGQERKARCYIELTPIDIGWKSV